MAAGGARHALPPGGAGTLAFDGKLIHVNDWKRLEDGDLNSTAYRLRRVSKRGGFLRVRARQRVKTFLRRCVGSLACVESCNRRSHVDVALGVNGTHSFRPVGTTETTCHCGLTLLTMVDFFRRAQMA